MIFLKTSTYQYVFYVMCYVYFLKGVITNFN